MVATNHKNQISVVLSDSYRTHTRFSLANLLGAKLPQKHDRVFLLRWTDSEFIMSVVGCNKEPWEAGARSLA